MDFNSSAGSVSLFFKNVSSVAGTSTPVHKECSNSSVESDTLKKSMKLRKRNVIQTLDEPSFNPPPKKMCFSNLSEYISINSDTDVDPLEANISVITIEDNHDTLQCEKTLIVDGKDSKIKEVSAVNEDLVLSDMSLHERDTTVGENTGESTQYQTISETYCLDISQLSNISTVSNIPIDSSEDTITPHTISHTEENDSVVFVSEIIPTDEGSPWLYGKTDYNQRNHAGQTQALNNLYHQGSLARPIYTIYNSKKTNPVEGTKRMVIIDGSNVAFAHSSQKKEFSVEGLCICIDYFTKKGFEVKAVVPQMRLKRSNSTNSELLEQLKNEGKVIITPCKSLPNGKSLISYDDRFILDLAYEFDAAIISNDNFRDICNENHEYKEIIESRVITYTFCKDVMLIAKDPYGMNGPTAEEILRK